MEVFQWVLFCLIASLQGASYAMSCGNCDMWSKWNRQCCTSRMMTRTRSCKGNNCVVQEAVYCGCAVNGQWSNWSQWSTCTKVCGYPLRKRRMTCTNPTPAYGGSDCSGDSYQTRKCGPVDRCQEWPQQPWSNWTSCTVSCEGGTQTRRKECTAADGSALPSIVQPTCMKYYIEKQVCNNQACPVDGSWSPWSSWSDCSASCGGGTRARKRSCDNPAPSAGGLLCTNNAKERVTCNVRACQENGDQLPVGAIVSIPLAVVITFAVLVGIFGYCRRKRQQKKGNHDDQLDGGRNVTNQTYDGTSTGGNIHSQNNATEYDSKYSPIKGSQECNYNTISLTSSASSQTPLVTNNYDVIGSVGQQHVHADYNHVRQAAHVANSGFDYSHVTSILNGVTTDDTYSHISNDNVSEQNKPSEATRPMDETYNHLQNPVFTSSRSGTATKASSHENDSTYNLANCKSANNRNLTPNVDDVEYNHANLPAHTVPRKQVQYMDNDESEYNLTTKSVQSEPEHDEYAQTSETSNELVEREEKDRHYFVLEPRDFKTNNPEEGPEYFVLEKQSYDTQGEMQN